MSTQITQTIEGYCPELKRMKEINIVYSNNTFRGKHIPEGFVCNYGNTCKTYEESGGKCPIYENMRLN